MEARPMNNLVGIYTVWLRDVIRFWRDKPRILGAIAQPALFLFILGTGLSGGFSKAFADGRADQFLPGVKNYITYMYPGIIGMTVLFTGIFAAISIIWDREFGFLKEILVAPISRWSVAVGKALGGSTVAMIQGSIMLVFAPVIGVTLTPLIVVELIPLMFLVSFAMTSLGIVVAARMKSMEGFQMIMNFLLMPMFFLSGAFFPLRGLPEWMDLLVKINPLSYGVDIMRYVVIGVNQYPVERDLIVLVAFSVVMMGLAMFQFGRTE